MGGRLLTGLSAERGTRGGLAARPKGAGDEWRDELTIEGAAAPLSLAPIGVLGCPITPTAGVCGSTGCCCAAAAEVEATCEWSRGVEPPADGSRREAAAAAAAACCCWCCAMWSRTARTGGWLLGGRGGFSTTGFFIVSIVWNEGTKGLPFDCRLLEWLNVEGRRGTRTAIGRG
uniref:Uncharacterized protein n=1 Tax=Pristionchus pacificus TaxID=54126 RepID=A0A2A6CZB8_PRIPA|eukprot:PDM83407.1 hypothetical protein PRIPAC_35039 [Pristionchus pacificus]